MDVTARRATTAWLLLVAVTLGSLAVADAGGVPGDVVTLLVIAAAAGKCVVVLARFMGARGFPRAWQAFFGAWLTVNALVILGFHLAA